MSAKRLVLPLITDVICDTVTLTPFSRMRRPPVLPIRARSSSKEPSLMNNVLDFANWVIIFKRVEIKWLWDRIQVLPYTQTIRVVLKDLIASLPEKTIFVHFILNFPKPGNAISQVVSQRSEARAVPMAQQVDVAIKVVAVAPLGFVIDRHSLELAIGVVFIKIPRYIGIYTHANVTDHHAPHVIILDGHPVSNRLENFILNINVTVQIYGKGRLVDHGLHARDTEVVIAVVKSGIYKPFFTKPEDLAANKRFLVGERDLRGVVEDLGEPRLFGVLVQDPAARAGVEGLQQPPVPGQVLDEGGAAVRRRVDVAVVAHGQRGLQGVAHHAGHRHRLQRLRLVVLEDVTPLAVQQEHHGLQPNSNGTVILYLISSYLPSNLYLLAVKAVCFTDGSVKDLIETSGNAKETAVNFNNRKYKLHNGGTLQDEWCWIKFNWEYREMLPVSLSPCQRLLCCSQLAGASPRGLRCRNKATGDQTGGTALSPMKLFPFTSADDLALFFPFSSVQAAWVPQATTKIDSDHYFSSLENSMNIRKLYFISCLIKQEPRVARVCHQGQVVALGIDPFENAIAADGEPVDLAPRHHHPQGQPARVPADVHRVPVAAGDGAHVPVPAVGEVVDVVPGDEVERVQVGAVDGELVELLVGGRGDLVEVGVAEVSPVPAHGADAHVAQVCHVQRVIGRHCQGRRFAALPENLNR
ncbi:hypothetical protein DV515_00007089 [Chloebia gouldiae]|uniref:Uncharacterized protein n=1 Tax=Chloebia gouldiae TaxID=44316 RepID=A0A3L8SJB7_CHLGU|nr:hypothetical protein DV515_00007089 [Chloebia gouldiae]